MPEKLTMGPLLCIVGARPNFVKIAPLMASLQNGDFPVSVKLIHTGQHYDDEMVKHFFEDLEIPKPDVNLEVGSASHALQTAEIMCRFESVLIAEKPCGIVVVGDVNSTIACALVAVKESVPVFHVEAGLRSFDRTMPEEINRVLTDQISSLLFTTEPAATENLTSEGIPLDRIHFVGNIMIDSLRKYLPKAVPAEQTLREYGLAADTWPAAAGYGLLTLHRPSNVDDQDTLRGVLEVIRQISEDTPVVFPMHPRTRSRLADSRLSHILESPRILQLPPVSYLRMLGLISAARFVMTDSGGLQEETTALQIPCLTLRSNTERPVTLEQGTNVLVGSDPVKIAEAHRCLLEKPRNVGRVPALWDGRTAERIVTILREYLS